MKRYILLNPGPANVTETVRNALLQPDLCHREKEFFEVMRRVREKLVLVAKGDSNYVSVIFSGSGTASVEAVICSAVPEGKIILLIDNGVYGDRIKKIADAHRIKNIAIHCKWGEIPDFAAIEHEIKANKDITHIAMVHHETTTGLLNPVHQVGDIAKKHGIKFIVDAMSSFAGEELDVIKDNIDYCISSSNKCIQGMPGLSFVVARKEELEKTKDNARSVYLNLYNQYREEENDNTPFTPAIPAFFALDKALDELFEEGLDNRIKRYAHLAFILRMRMADLGFKTLLPKKYMSHILTTYLLPKGLNYDLLHDKIKEKGFIIYAGQADLKKYAFRISNMGNLSEKDIKQFIVSLKQILKEIQIKGASYD